MAAKAGCRFDTKGKTTKIYLPSGHVSTIDTNDLVAVKNYAWHALRGKTSLYVYAQIGRPQKSIQLHRLILGFPKSDVDHRDGNGLNNRRKNLRPASESQNGANARKTTEPRSSIYKGVTRKNGKWHARIRKTGKLLDLGGFQIEKEAAKAYDRAALYYFGDFARLNFPAERAIYLKEPYSPRTPALICDMCREPIANPWLKKVSCSNRCRLAKSRARRGR